MQAGPCRHILAACRSEGYSWTDFMHPKHKTVAWKNGFLQQTAIRVPSTAEIGKFAHLEDDKLALPPVIKARTGRPKKHKRRKSQLEKMRERKKKKAN